MHARWQGPCQLVFAQRGQVQIQDFFAFAAFVPIFSTDGDNLFNDPGVIAMRTDFAIDFFQVSREFITLSVHTFDTFNECAEMPSVDGVVSYISH